jgi:mRNA interferase MazF
VILARGAIVLVSLDPTRGREQAGTRPAVVVTSIHVGPQQRFQMIGVVPVTSRLGLGRFYPVLSPGTTGLKSPSTALVDQIRAIDPSRLIKLFGTASGPEIAAVDAALRQFLGL